MQSNDADNSNFSKRNLSEQQRTAGRRYLKVWGIFFWAVAAFFGACRLVGFLSFPGADNRLSPWINNEFFFWGILVLLPLAIGIGFWRMKKWSVVPYLLFCGLWLMLQILLGGINLIFMGFDATLLAIGLNMLSLWRSNQLA